MNLTVIKQVAEIVSKLTKKELESLLSVDGSVVVNSDNVNLEDVELHSTTDEDYYEDIIEIAKGYGWEVSEWNILSRNGIRLPLESFYILGDFDGFVTADGSYLDLETGKVLNELERDILRKVADGKYSIVNIKKAILEKNIDYISGLIGIDEGVDMDDSSGSYFYCTLKENLESMPNPYDCLRYFPNRGDDVVELDIPVSIGKSLKQLYRGMVDGFMVVDSGGYKFFGYDLSGCGDCVDRQALGRFESKTGFHGYERVIVVENGGELKKVKCFSYGKTLLVM